MQQQLAMGIDLGGTNLKAALVDRDGRIIAKASQPVDVARGPDAVIDEMVAMVDSLLAGRSCDRSDLVCVGVGSPGPLSIREGRIHHSANLPGWRNVPLRDTLSEKLQRPVVLDNDGNAAAFGEFWVGAGGGCNDLVMLTLGTGVGAGVVLNGALVHGHFENAAELGHLIVEVDGLPCPCGQHGCLEQYSSASAVARRVVTAIEQGQACALAAGFQSGQPVDCVNVVQCAKDGDAVCTKIWDEACMYLAVAVIDIQHAYNPARIVLGGGMSSAGAFLLDRISDHLTRRCWSLHDDLPVITLSELGTDAGVIGAAGLAWRHANDAP